MGATPQRNKSNYGDSKSAISFEYYPSNQKIDVLIGTPYAFHSLKMRSGKTKQYWKILNPIITDGNFVYLTDVFKIYCAEKIQNQKNNKVEYNRYVQGSDEYIITLKQEINNIKPDLIVLFGNEAIEAVGLKLDYKISEKIETHKLSMTSIFDTNLSDCYVLPLMHPSNRIKENVKQQYLQVMNNHLDENCASLSDSYCKIILKNLR